MDAIYVCLFSNGHIKVGRSNSPHDRINTHAERVSCLGVTLVDSRVFECLDESKFCERDLIAFCQQQALKQNQCEWFEGLDFETVCAYAAQVAGTAESADETGWGAYLKRILRCGYTQYQVAELIGCAQPSVANVANGRTTSPSFMVGYGLLQIGRKHGLADPVEVFPIKAEF